MKQYIVDAFTDEVFKGNQAAVCVLDKWIPDQLMQNIAKENNFSETAFTVRDGDGYRLRWFTPGGEIDFCGHATLGAAFVLVNFYDSDLNQIHFYTRTGELTVIKSGDLYEMDCPAYEYSEIPVTDEMEEAFGARPCRAVLSRDLLAIFDSEDTVRKMVPDQAKIKALEGLCVGVTAHQASSRTGTLICRCIGDRVKISGKAVVYSVSEILSL